MCFTIYIVGFDATSSDQSLLRSALEKSLIIVASKRLYGKLEEITELSPLPPFIPVVPLAESIEVIKESLKNGNVTVLASGDPLFFGIGRKLVHSLPGQKIIIYPVISSMQMAFARFNISWDDAKFVSLHGRSNKRLAARLLSHSKTFVLTDPSNSPDYIAKKLLAECGEKTVSQFSIYVAEHLGRESERLIVGNLSQIATQKFADPNVVIFLRAEDNKQTYPEFGLQEHEICHSRGLITKNEVRAASIHALRLPRKGVLWDVGAGSGSVGLEAARIFPELQVFAIEKKGEQWRNIKANQKQFSIFNIKRIQGEAPVALQELEDPDRVFIGGSGGNLKEIIECCAERLQVNGVIVVNAVISKTAKTAPEVLHALKFDVEVREIAVQRYSYPKGKKEKFNPIKIIVGHKKSQESE